MATYREAWGLFQDEPMLPSSSTITEPGMTVVSPDQSTAPSAISKTELVSELRRLQKDLQELQSASGTSQHSDRSGPYSSTTQPDSLLPHSESGPEKSEPFRCWESCCNGRLFSNRSNLARHQRERKGESAKLRCSFCDAAFLRSSSRNAHEAARRCQR